LINCIAANAQLEYSKWLLEENLYFDFVENDTIRWTGDFPGLRSDVEPMVMVCDSEGELLFYCTSTRGSQRSIVTIDREFNIMPNGNNLEGHRSATQGVVAVKSLINSNQYFIFTMYADNPLRLNLHYSVLDMSLNNGYGDIIAAQKNILLDEGPLSEKMVVVPGICNNYWLIVHELETANFRIYNIDENGVHLTPDLFNIGVVPASIISSEESDYSRGEMVISQNFDKLAMILESGYLEIYDFNNETGVISNATTIENNFSNGYSVCFSPSSQYLYADIDNAIYQYDLSLSSIQDIKASKLLVLTDQSTVRPSIRIGIDNYLYIKKKYNFYRLSLPDEAFVLNSQLELVHSYREGLSATSQVISLDNLPEPFYVISTPPKHLPEDLSICLSDSVEIKTESDFDRYSWSTGEDTPSIYINSSGTYWVDVTQGSCTFSDTIQITIADQSTLDLGDMILTCNTDPITLMSNIDGETYKWSTGEDTPIIEVTATGSYTLEIESTEGCIYRDTIDIVFDELSVDLGADQEICIGDSTILSAPSPETLSSIVWSDGSEDPSLIVRSADSYWLAIERGMCFASDTIMISYGVCDMIPDSMMMDTMMIDTMTGSPGFFVPDEPCQVYVPNAISADATRPLNRVFQIFSDCDLASVSISIYDRWGNLHHRTSDRFMSTDNMLLNPGVYVAKIAYRFVDMEEEQEVLQSVTVL